MIISEADDIPQGVVITGKFSKLDCGLAITKNKRTKESMLNSLYECRKWHTYLTNKQVERKFQNVIDDIETLINETL